MVSRKRRSKPPIVRQEAQRMNNYGIAPADVLDYLIEKYGAEDAPSMDTYKRWMRDGKKDGSWLNWRIGADLPATMKPDRKAQVSFIDDAILHLSIVAAKRSVAEHAMNSSSDTDCIRAVLWDVHQLYEPGAEVLTNLRKALRPYIKDYRANPEQRQGFSLPSVEDAYYIETIMKEVDDEE